MSIPNANDSNSRRCAACKYLRRRCSEDCTLSPYFPASDPYRFACVHKIFGASNVARMLQQIPINQRALAVESISSEAYNRVQEDQDPVYGSTRIISLLQHKILISQHELATTQAQIAMCVAEQHAQQQPPAQTYSADAHQQEPLALDKTFLDPSHFPNLF